MDLSGPGIDVKFKERKKERTTQKEQLADTWPTAPICNHTDMGL